MAIQHTAIEDFLVDSFNGNEGMNVQPLLECKDDQIVESNLDSMKTTASQIYMKDKDSNPREIDWSYIFDKTMPEEVREGFMAEVDEKDPGAQKLWEGTANAIQASQWHKFFDRCITTTFAEIMCRAADFQLRPLFQRIDMPCAEFNIRQQCEIVVPRIKANYDIETDLGEMPTMWVNLGDRRCIRFPRLGLNRIGFALNRSLVCLNATDQVRTLLDRTIRENLGWDDELMQYRALFATDGANDSDGSPTCPNQFWMDSVVGTGYRSDVTDLWVNRFGGSELKLTPTNYTALCTIERLWEDARDPHTGRPNACPGDFQLLMTSLCEIGLYRTLITAGQQRTLSELPGDAADSTEFIRPLTARAGWSASVAYSPYIMDELSDFYENNDYNFVEITDGVEDTALSASTNAAEAKTQAQNTYVVSKSFTDSVGWGVDFDITTWEIEGTNTQQFLDRGITFQRMYEYKRAAVWQRPWLNLLIHAYDPIIS